MGVRGLFAYLRQNYPNAFKASQDMPGTYGKSLGLTDVYLDGNALLYPIASITKNPKEIGKKLLEVAIAYSQAYSCKCHIYMDGPAHMGKVKQQRTRRFGYEPLTNILTATTNVGERKGVNILPSPGGTIPLIQWSSAVFSPGTEMMEKIHQYIVTYLKQHQPKEIGTYSSYHDPGEGEHKIIRDIKKNASGSKVAIVGKDADLLLLGMSITQGEGYNIYPIIIRHNDTPPGMGGKFIGNENGYTPNDPIFYIDCTILHREIISSYKSRSRTIWDFIIATFLMGNDFLPPIPELSDVRQAIPIILSTLPSLYIPRQNGKGSINWESFHIFITALLDTIDRNDSYRKNIYIPWIQGISKNQKNEGKVPGTQLFDSIYYFDMSPFPVNKDNLVLAWITTIQWIFTYYHDGLDAASIAWQYPPYYSPSLYTLYTYPSWKDKNVYQMANTLSTRKVEPLTPSQALAAMLPIWLHDLIHNEETRRKVSSLGQFYPYAYQILPSTKDPIIPIIPYEVVSTL